MKAASSTTTVYLITLHSAQPRVETISFIHSFMVLSGPFFLYPKQLTHFIYRCVTIKFLIDSLM